MSTQELKVNNDFARITMNAIRTQNSMMKKKSTPMIMIDCDVFEEEEEAT